MKDKTKIIVIMGAQAAGKSFLEKWVDEVLRIPRLISHTTRPRRDGESYSEYHFVSNLGFDQLEHLDGGFIEERKYKVASGEIWRYGLHKSAVNAPLHVVVVDYQGYADMRDQGYDLVPIHVYVDRAESYRRIEKFRPGYPMDECERRFTSDIERIQVPAKADDDVYHIDSRGTPAESQAVFLELLDKLLPEYNLVERLDVNESTNERNKEGAPLS